MGEGKEEERRKGGREGGRGRKGGRVGEGKEGERRKGGRRVGDRGGREGGERERGGRRGQGRGVHGEEKVSTSGKHLSPNSRLHHPLPSAFQLHPFLVPYEYLYMVERNEDCNLMLYHKHPCHLSYGSGMHASVKAMNKYKLCLATTNQFTQKYHKIPSIQEIPS